MILSWVLCILNACVQPETGPVEIVSPLNNATFEGGKAILFEAAADEIKDRVAGVKWDFGDGTTAAAISATHAYDKKGKYNVTFTATDEYGEEYRAGLAVEITSCRFIKLDEEAVPLPDNATSWRMVLDNTTGLVWEVKNSRDCVEDYSNPSDSDNKYTWYDDNTETNGGDAGTPGDDTDTQDFIEALNDSLLGGHSDWRMSTCAELGSILDPARFNPAANTDYFPGTAPWYYWSATTYEDFTYAACHIYFMGTPAPGTSLLITTKNHYGMKDLYYHARAVRGADEDQ